MIYDNLLSNFDFFKKLDMSPIYIQGVTNYYNNILKIPYIFFKAFTLYPQQDFLVFSYHSANSKCFVKMSWKLPIMSADVYLLTKTHTHRSPIARYTCWQHSYATKFPNETLWFYIWEQLMVWLFKGFFNMISKKFEVSLIPFKVEKKLTIHYAIRIPWEDFSILPI